MCLQSLTRENCLVVATMTFLLFLVSFFLSFIHSLTPASQSSAMPHNCLTRLMCNQTMPTCLLAIRYVYVITWGHVLLRINCRRVFKIFQNCPRRFATRAIWKILKTQVQLILNSTRSHGITCLSIKGKIMQRISQSLTGNHALSWLLKMPSIKKKCPLSQPISAQ